MLTKVPAVDTGLALTMRRRRHLAAAAEPCFKVTRCVEPISISHLSAIYIWERLLVSCESRRIHGRQRHEKFVLGNEHTKLDPRINVILMGEDHVAHVIQAIHNNRERIWSWSGDSPASRKYVDSCETCGTMLFLGGCMHTAVICWSSLSTNC